MSTAKGYKAIVIGVAVEKEELVLLAKGDTCLVEDAIVETDILALSLGGYLNHLEGLETDAVGLGKSHDIGNEYSCRRTESADGQ